MAYPPHMRMYSDFETLEDVEDYAECDGAPFCHVDEGWYILGCDDPGEAYVADLASARPLGFAEVNKIIGVLRGFGNKPITASCRQSTSYRLLHLMEKRGVIKILEDRHGNNWGGEVMREVKFKVNPQGFKEWLTITEALDPKVKERLERVSEKIFPDREALKKLIDDMEREPRIVPPAEAFNRVNQASGGGQVSPTTKTDQTLEKFKRMVSHPSAAMNEFQSEYSAGRIKTPELLSLAFFHSKGADDAKLRLLASEMSRLDPKWRERILFKDKPEISSGEGAPVSFDDINRFSDAVHQLEGLSTDFTKKIHFDPKRDISPESQKNLVAKGGGIWIYKGPNPSMCRTYGKNTPWCIASSTSTQHYFNYRVEHGQTQFFIFDDNKSNDDPARITNPGIAPEGEYSEWVDLRNTHGPDPDDRRNEFGINGYKSIADYKKYLAGRLGKTIEELDAVLVPEPVTDEEKKLRKYLSDYENAT